MQTDHDVLLFTIKAVKHVVRIVWESFRKNEGRTLHHARLPMEIYKFLDSPQLSHTHDHGLKEWPEELLRISSDIRHYLRVFGKRIVLEGLRHFQRLPTLGLTNFAPVPRNARVLFVACMLMADSNSTHEVLPKMGEFAAYLDNKFPTSRGILWARVIVYLDSWFAAKNNLNIKAARIRWNDTLHDANDWLQLSTMPKLPPFEVARQPAIGWSSNDANTNPGEPNAPLDHWNRSVRPTARQTSRMKLPARNPICFGASGAASAASGQQRNTDWNNSYSRRNDEPRFTNFVDLTPHGVKPTIPDKKENIVDRSSKPPVPDPAVAEEWKRPLFVGRRRPMKRFSQVLPAKSQTKKEEDTAGMLDTTDGTDGGSSKDYGMVDTDSIDTNGRPAKDYGVLDTDDTDDANVASNYRANSNSNRPSKFDDTYGTDASNIDYPSGSTSHRITTSEDDATGYNYEDEGDSTASDIDALTASKKELTPEAPARVDMPSPSRMPAYWDGGDGGDNGSDIWNTPVTFPQRDKKSQKKRVSWADESSLGKRKVRRPSYKITDDDDGSEDDEDYVPDTIELDTTDSAVVGKKKSSKKKKMHKIPTDEDPDGDLTPTSGDERSSSDAEWKSTGEPDSDDSNGDGNQTGDETPRKKDTEDSKTPGTKDTEESETPRKKNTVESEAPREKRAEKETEPRKTDYFSDSDALPMVEMEDEMNPDTMILPQKDGTPEEQEVPPVADDDVEMDTNSVPIGPDTMIVPPKDGTLDEEVPPVAEVETVARNGMDTNSVPIDPDTMILPQKDATPDEEDIPPPEDEDVADVPEAIMHSKRKSTTTNKLPPKTPLKLPIKRKTRAPDPETETPKTPAKKQKTTTNKTPAKRKSTAAPKAPSKRQRKSTAPTKTPKKTPAKRKSTKTPSKTKKTTAKRKSKAGVPSKEQEADAKKTVIPLNIPEEDEKKAVEEKEEKIVGVSSSKKATGNKKAGKLRPAKIFLNTSLTPMRNAVDSSVPASSPRMGMMKARGAVLPSPRIGPMKGRDGNPKTSVITPRNHSRRTAASPRFKSASATWAAAGTPFDTLVLKVMEIVDPHFDYDLQAKKSFDTNLRAAFTVAAGGDIDTLVATGVALGPISISEDEEDLLRNALRELALEAAKSAPPPLSSRRPFGTGTPRNASNTGTASAGKKMESKPKKEAKKETKKKKATTKNTKSAARKRKETKGVRFTEDGAKKEEEKKEDATVVAKLGLKKKKSATKVASIGNMGGITGTVDKAAPKSARAVRAERRRKSRLNLQL